MKLKLSWKSCLLGCVGVVVIMVIFAVAFGVWLTRKQSFEVETTILAESSQAFLRMNLKADDEVLVDFVSTHANKLNEAGSLNSSLPQFFQDFQKNQTRRDIEKLLPLEVEFSGNVAEQDYGVAIGFSVYNNIAKIGYFFAKRDARKKGVFYEYGGYTYLKAPERGEKAFFGLNNNIIYLATSESTMKGMFDAHGRIGISHQEDQRLEGIDLTAPIYGFCNGPAASSAFLRLTENKVLRPKLLGESDAADDSELAFLDRVDRLGFDLRLDGKEALAGNLVFQTQDRTEEMRQSILAVVENMGQDSDLDVTQELKEDPLGFRVVLKISGFERVAENLGASHR